ncbi:MAG TPA: aldo/keto reductase [Burkholderiaceae bacterium]|nr:aldo/keto reductase [Burkholderiaceae bacterium]
MDRIKLGRSDLEVSRVCLGTMTWGQQATEAQAHSQLDRALERGIDFIDTAEIYPIPVSESTYGATETIVGNWLAHQRRDRVVIATKVAGPGRATAWIRSGLREGLPALSKRDVVFACEASLKRLRTDYVDLYQIHWPARNVPMFGLSRFEPAQERSAVSAQEQLEAIAQLIRDGKIRHVGVSNETPWGVCEFVKLSERFDLPRIVSIQNVYNLLSREFESGLAEACFRESVTLLGYSPLAFGFLTGKYLNGARPPGARLTLFGDRWPRYRDPRIDEATALYRKIAEKAHLTPTQMALAFAFHNRHVGSTIVGANTVAQLDEIVDAYDTRLDDETLAAIEAVHRRITNPAP